MKMLDMNAPDNRANGLVPAIPAGYIVVTSCSAAGTDGAGRLQNGESG
jgi:hypothetical protein